jgi:hypothetical protein
MHAAYAAASGTLSAGGAVGMPVSGGRPTLAMAYASREKIDPPLTKLLYGIACILHATLNG